MDKRQLIRDTMQKLSDQQIVYKRWEVSPVIDAVLSVLLESFKRREQVALKGFGKFEVKRYKPRAYTCPNGARKIMPARYKVVYTTATQFRFDMDLKDTSWELTQIYGAPVTRAIFAGSASCSLHFKTGDDGNFRISGQGVHQRVAGTCLADPETGKVRFRRTATDKVVPEQDQSYFMMLDTADKYLVQDNVLTLFCKQIVTGRFSSKHGLLLQQL